MISPCAAHAADLVVGVVPGVLDAIRHGVAAMAT